MFNSFILLQSNNKGCANTIKQQIFIFILQFVITFVSKDRDKNFTFTYPKPKPIYENKF